MKNENSEVIDIANAIEIAHTCGFIGSAAQYEHLHLSAVDHLRRLPARNQELEKDLKNAKRLVSKIWDKHPEARETIEEGTGAWLVFGQDVETGGVSAPETSNLLARIEKEISTAQINNHRMAAPFGKMEGEPCVRVSSLLATIEGFLNEVNGQQAAAPVVLPEPGINTANHAGVRVVGYTEQQVRDLLDKATCTKSQTTAPGPFGYFKAEPFGWRDCAETDEGAIALYEAPQPLPSARDAERYRFLRSRDLETVNNGGVFAGVTPDNIVLNGTDLDAEIDAAIAAAKGAQE